MGLCCVLLPPTCAALRYDVSSFVAPSIPTSPPAMPQSMQDILSVSRYGWCDTFLALFHTIELNKSHKEYDNYLLGPQMGPRVCAVDVTWLLQRVSPRAVWPYSSCHVPSEAGAPGSLLGHF